MLVCVWLVSSLIHMISGCVLPDSETLHITGFTGESVVLPCTCTDVQRKPKQFKWTVDKGDHTTVIFSQSPPSVNDHYKRRVQVLDSISPGNLSLHLSDLTLSDGGTYWCEVNGHYKDIFLTVKGCSLSAPTEVTGYTGGSVVLPCYCTKGQPTPNTARWFFFPDPSNIEHWWYSNEAHKDRVITSASPGDLSLRLSDLTLSDLGLYRCAASRTIYRNISLTVEACVPPDSEPIHITGFTGGSVVLPCVCTDVQRKTERVKWTAHPGGQSTVIFPQSPPSVNDRYKHRVQVLDSISPGILSLRLSDLTLSDGGQYRCEADGQHRDISLTVKGCSLYAPTQVTGYTRGSVVLPCYCTEGQPTQSYVGWYFLPRDIWFWSYPNTVDDQYKDRVNISATAGNLSLRLSDLTLSDRGTYRCAADGQHRDIILTVKGCSLPAPTEVTGYTGGSVVLPCYCTEGQPTLKSARWGFFSRGSNITLWSYPKTVDGRYKDRVNISATPENLSISLSDLTLSDEGTYRCEADGHYRNISLTVEEATAWSPTTTKHTSTHGSKPPPKKEISEDLKNSILYATIAVVAAVAVCGAVLFYCRFRSRKNAHVESREEQEMGTGEQEEEENADSVTYSTVVHSKTSKNTNIQNQSEDSTEYAAIKLGVSSNL